MDEPAGELPSDPASLFHVRLAELSKEGVASESNTIMDDIFELKMDESAAKLSSDPVSLPHVPPAQLSRESVGAESNTIRDVIVELKMDEFAAKLPSDLGSLSPVPPTELGKESIAAESNTIMDDIVELKMDKSTVELPSDPGSASLAPSPELSMEGIAAESNTIMDDDEAKNTISMGQATCDVLLSPKEESADELHSETGSLLHIPPTDLNKESITAESNAVMDNGEAKNTISMDQPTCGVQQLVDEWKHCCPKDESAAEVHSEPGSLLYVAPTELSKESIVAKLNIIMGEADSENIISMGNSAYGWKLVEELERRGGEIEPSEETFSQSVQTVLDVDKVENATSNNQVTNAMHLVEELHPQNDESGHSVLPAGHSVLPAKPIPERDEVESITSNGEATHLVQLGEDTVLNIPSAEVSEKLMESEMNTSPKDDEVVTIILTDQTTNDLQLVEDLHQQKNETKSSDEKPVLNNAVIENTGHATKDLHLVGDLCPQGDEAGVSKNATLVAETELQVGTVNGSKGLMVEDAKIAEELHKQMVDSEAQKREKANLKLTLDKKRTEIAGELESLKAQTNQKLKKIGEIAQQEEVKNTEIANLESRCSECKCRHEKFIDLFKLVVESQLPLHAHREIVLLMNKEDKAAQKFLSKALELQIQIDNQAKLKLTLQEERTELAKLVEALKVRMDQKLKEADEVNKIEEAADSETTPRTVCQRTLVYTRSCRKRKTCNRQLAEELSPPEGQAKRTALNTVGSSQECVHDGMVTDP